jgi:hypothetical protein
VHSCTSASTGEYTHDHDPLVHLPALLSHPAACPLQSASGSRGACTLDRVQPTPASSPLQVQSNALAALEAIDANMARDVMAEGCITGDRINGLCDGVSGDWYVKFDTFHPAVRNGLPVTRVISRVTLQNILARYATDIGGEGVITPDTKICEYEEDQVQGHDRVRRDQRLQVDLRGWRVGAVQSS